MGVGCYFISAVFLVTVFDGGGVGFVVIVVGGGGDGQMMVSREDQMILEAKLDFEQCCVRHFVGYMATVI